MRHALLFLFLAGLPVAADDEPLSFAGRPYVRTWTYHSLRSRTGRGYSEYLALREPADGKPGVGLPALWQSNHANQSLHAPAQG